MQKAYNKLDIVVNIASSLHSFQYNLHIGLLNSANINNIEICAILIQYLVNISICHLCSERMMNCITIVILENNRILRKWDLLVEAMVIQKEDHKSILVRGLL